MLGMGKGLKGLSWGICYLKDNGREALPCAWEGLVIVGWMGGVGKMLFDMLRCLWRCLVMVRC